MSSELTYWEKRFLQTKAKQIKNSEDYERALQPKLRGLQRDLDGELNKYYRRYAQTNNIPEKEVKQMLGSIGNSSWQMTLEQFEEKAKAGGYEKELDSEYFKSRISRLQNLDEQMKYHTRNFAKSEQTNMSDALSKQFDDSYMRTIYKTQSAKMKFGGNFASFNEDQLKTIVSKPWKGSNFSKRIWGNYTQTLPNKLMDTLLRGSLLGCSPDKLTTMMHERFKDVSRKDIHRLVNSEMAHVNEKATAQGYEESDIEEYEYMATLESHTCAVCGHLDGKRFKLSERKDGVNYPIIHANCRCTTVPYIEGLSDIENRWNRDPETGKGKFIKNMKFDEWKKQYIPTAIKAAEQTNISKKDSQNGLSVNRKLVNSKRFHDKFVVLDLPKQTQEALYKNSMTILEHRDGSNYEDLYVIDQRTGELVVKQDTSIEEGKTGLTYDQFCEVQEYAEPMVLLHNHPNSSRPSIADILTLFRNPKIMQSVVVSHNGKVATIKISPRSIDIEFLYKRWYNLFVREGYAKQEANILATDKVYESGAIIHDQN